MTTLAIDASAAAAWLLPGQTTAAAQSLEASLHEHDLIVPNIFAWEMRNVLIRQRRRTPAFDLHGALLRLEAFEFDVHDNDLAAELDILTDIADAGRVSLFDAAYFWVAASKRATLVSRDSGLLALCRVHGIDHLDLR